MTREEAIKVLKMVEAHGLAEEAKQMAIQALSQEPCDDAISRDAVLEKMADYVASGYADSAEDFEEYSKIICQLPSVTQKSGKWDRLYNWLNDMRFGIAPDETVYDDTERVVRESQVDILDEIMEWMERAESEDKE